MAPTPSIKVIKHTAYKGGVKTWSNRYHFTGSDLTGTTEFTTLADNVTAAEKLCLSDFTVIDEVVGYDAGSDVPVYSKTYSLTGSQTLTGGEAYCPLECAALVRFSTTQRSVKNHPIYLFNYVHSVIRAASSDHELLGSTMKTAIETYASAWLSGFSDGTNVRIRCGPNGAVAQSRLVNQFITHRDFPD